MKHMLTNIISLAVLCAVTHVQTSSLPAERFRQLDRNGDGRLTADEFPYPVVFKQLDLDRDGALSPSEAEEIPTRRQNPAPSPALVPTPVAKSKSPPAVIPPDEVPRNVTASTGLARLAFTQDYFPGSRDARGNFMGGTEAMWLAGHDGKLFAAIGYGQDRPGNDPKPGAQVLRKDAADVPWVVDHGFEPDCMRVEGLISFAFTTDVHCKPLSRPVRLLIASPSELTQAGGTSAVFIRNDATGQWQRSEITGGHLGVRSFGSHMDKVTGVHHLFTGLNRGGIHRGSYDPAAPGGIRWEPLPERTATAQPGKGRRIYDYSRVLCFAECNGDLYMASRITIVGTGASLGD